MLVHYHRGRERAEAVAAELGGAPVAGADLTNEEDVDRLFAQARETLAGVDVCTAVAGVWPQDEVPVWELPLERWRATLDANLTSAFLTARAFLREVERNGHGSLVLVASTAGLVGEAAMPTTRQRSRPSPAGSYSASRTRLSASLLARASTASRPAGRSRP